MKANPARHRARMLRLQIELPHGGSSREWPPRPGVKPRPSGRFRTHCNESSCMCLLDAIFDDDFLRDRIPTIRMTHTDIR